MKDRVGDDGRMKIHFESYERPTSLFEFAMTGGRMDPPANPIADLVWGARRDPATRMPAGRFLPRQFVTPAASVVGPGAHPRRPPPIDSGISALISDATTGDARLDALLEAPRQMLMAAEQKLACDTYLREDSEF